MEPKTKSRTTSLRMQTYQELKKLIEGKTWEIGDKLPSEKDLCIQYDVSRVTIRSAIQQLEAVGLVQTHQGGRTLVMRHHTKGSVSSLNPLKPASLQEDIIKVLEYQNAKDLPELYQLLTEDGEYKANYIKKEVGQNTLL